MLWSPGPEFCKEMCEMNGKKILLFIVPSFAEKSQFVMLNTNKGNPDVQLVDIGIEI